MSAFEKHFSVRKMNIKSKQRQFPDNLSTILYRCLLQSFINAIEEYAKGRGQTAKWKPV